MHALHPDGSGGHFALCHRPPPLPSCLDLTFFLQQFVKSPIGGLLPTEEYQTEEKLKMAPKPVVCV